MSVEDNCWGGAFKKWVCVFPGKMSISWKLASNLVYDTRQEAEKVASQNCNVVVIPLGLYNKYKGYEFTVGLFEERLISLKFTLDKIYKEFREAQDLRIGNYETPP